jgi:ribosomal protein L12E/L44/L45/RPP1/RPP2
LSSWLDVDPKTGKRKIDDPKFVQEKKVYLDSVYERILKHIKDSSNAMADEEKQRLQILVLPDNAMDEVIKEVKGYQAALRGIMSSAAAKEWSQNNKGKVNEVIKALGFDPSSDKTSLGQQLATLGGIIVSSLSKNNELPHDVATNLQAAKDKFDTYMKNMMLSATVAPHIVANVTAILGNTIADEYNDQARVAGRDRADYLDSLKDISGSIPRDAMPLSELIKHSDYVWPSLNTVSDAKISSQAESEGENSPADAYADVPGVSSTVDYSRYK